MQYAQVSDLQARYPIRDLVQLSDPAAQSINAGPLNQALADASAEIDSYIESRFSLPIADPPPVLKIACCEIAMYRVQALRPMQDIEDALNRYTRWLKWLEKVAKGDLTLGITSDTNAEPVIQTPSVVLTGPSPTAIFSRKTLRGF
jgi:phage gp36-like protein